MCEHDASEHMDNGVSVHICPNDSREKLEADLEKLRKQWKEYDGNFMRIYSYVAYSQIVELLDRQEAITKREEILSYECTAERQSDRIFELHNKLADAQEDIAKLNTECEQYRDNMLAQSRRVAELTEERDELRRERNAAIGRANYMESAATEELFKLLGENDTIEVYDDKIRGKRRLVTGTQRKLEKYEAELRAERDQYKQNAKILADKARQYRDERDLYEVLAVNAELWKDERDELQEAIDAMGNGQFYAMYRKACEERDHFKDLVRKQSESNH